MKLYTVYLLNPDTNALDQFFGVFNSEEKIKDEIKKLSLEIEYEIPEDNLKIIEIELDKNYLIN